MYTLSFYVRSEDVYEKRKDNPLWDLKATLDNMVVSC